MAVGVGEGVFVGVGVGVGVGLGLGDGDGIGVGVGLGVAVAVGLGVGDGVGVGVGKVFGFRVISNPSQSPPLLIVAVSAVGIVPALAIGLSPSNEVHWLELALVLVRSAGPVIQPL